MAIDAVGYLRATGTPLVGAPAESAPSWLIDYDSTCMDGRAFFCVPLPALDALDGRLRLALDAVDGHNVRHGTPELRAAGLRVAVALGAVSADDVEVDNFDLPEALRLGDDDLALLEVLWPCILGDPAPTVLPLDRLSINVERILVIADR